jgi:hypothetical protein
METVTLVEIGCAIMLGATPAIDRKIRGQSVSIGLRVVASLGALAFVRYNGNLALREAFFPAAWLPVVAWLAPWLLWMDARARLSTHAADRAEGNICCLLAAISCGVACGLENWGLVAGSWIEMFCLYVSGLTVGTEEQFNSRSASLGYGRT